MGIAGIANGGLKFLFGDWALDFGRLLARKEHGLIRRAKNPGVLKHENASLFQGVKTAYNDAQRLSLRNAGIKATEIKNTSFFKYMKGSAISWGHEFKSGWKEASALGKSKGIAKALFGGAAKRMPLIGTVACLIAEVPNIWRAFTHKDGGVGTGTVEVAKTGIKLGAVAGGAAAGAAIGSLICPVAGTAVGAAIGLIGSMIGGSVAYSITDAVIPSFTEQEEAKEAATAQAKAKAEATGNSATSVLPKTYTSQADATSIGNPSFAFGANGLDLSGLTQDELSKYNQLKAAYASYTSNPFGSSYMDRNIYG